MAPPAGSVLTPLFVPSVVPGAAQPRTAGPHTVLPLAAVPTPRPHDAAVYGMAAIDDRGRITDHVVLRALRWAPGTSFDLEVSVGVATLTARPGVAGRITRVGRFRLPASVRHQLHLAPGDRVLLVARPAASQLVVHPAAALDAILAGTGPSSLGDPT